jgi:hypothetical protein
MCESPELRQRLGRGRCPADTVGGSQFRLSVGLGGLFGVDLVEGDGVAERFELSLEAAGSVFDGVALALPVGSEVSVWDLVADDVEVGHEQVVADRADRFGFTAPSAELREVRGEVGLFGSDRGACALGQLVGQPAWSGAGAPRASPAG